MTVKSKPRAENTLQSEKRTMSVSPSIIMSLIKAQSGSLAKAVLECVMNSVDAGATSVDIAISRTRLSIIDNGKGFSTRDEILACFEVFGWEHTEGERVYGQFGIGRAQLWNYCDNLWRTRTFSMAVDVRKNGIDYDLTTGLPDVDGLSITGKFYAPLKTSELMAFEKDVAELARYAQIPVTINGKIINVDPSIEKWTHVTDDAWIRILDGHGDMKVFNLGVLAQRFDAYKIGCGGVVVTKPGVRLAMNMARNEILTAECKVWKRVKPFLQKKSDMLTKKRKRPLQTYELDNIAMRYLSNELSVADVDSVKLIIDVQSRSYTLAEFCTRAGKIPVITGQSDSQLMDMVHQKRLAFVISGSTLARFRVETPSALLALFNKLASKNRFVVSTQEMSKFKFLDDSTSITKSLSSDHGVVDAKDLDKEETVVVAVLAKTGFGIRRAFYWAGVCDWSDFTDRTIRVGTSDTDLAWTDGKSTIFIERRQLKNARSGLAGIQALVALLVHEYGHNENTAGSHMHSFEFYKQYHDIMLQPKSAIAIAGVAQTAFKLLMSTLHEKGIKVRRALLDSSDALDSSSAVLLEDVTEDEPAAALRIAA
jgi:hypothetical protein